MKLEFAANQQERITATSDSNATVVSWKSTNNVNLIQTDPKNSW